MSHVTETMDFAATPAAVWALVGNPNAISDWHPAIATSPVSDGVRRCTLVGGGDLVEPILEHSDEDRFYMYAIAESPFPLTGYQSRITVEEADSGSRIVWQADFTPDDPATDQEMTDTFGDIFRAGLESVRERADSAVAPS